jgi:Flp pilus assembly protein TadG
VRVTDDCLHERGAVAVIVAILLVVLFGFAAFALDSGNAWQARRHLVTATDAAALAAAREFALGRDGCAGTDDALVDLNYPGSDVERCTASTEPGRGPGYVTVAANHDVEWTFARVFGLTAGTIRSSTTASWGNPLGLQGLRPLGLCAQFPGLAAWLASGPTGPSSTIRIPYTKDQPDRCGANAPGNWAVHDFDGGANSSNDTRNWMANGYPGMVDKDSWIPGDTGAFSNSLNSELQMLVTSGQTFTLPVFDAVSGNGSNARFYVVDFVGVKLIGFRATGPEAQRYIDLQFQLMVAQGSCCDRGGPFRGVSVVRICSVDRAVLDPDRC